jgi:hypothetical protein
MARPSVPEFLKKLILLRRLIRAAHQQVTATPDMIADAVVTALKRSRVHFR